MMPVKPLPVQASLEHLKSQARDLLRAHGRRDRAAAQRLREFHPRFQQATDDTIFGKALKLAGAQLAIARERGFASWTRLRGQVLAPGPAGNLALPHHERIEDEGFRRAVTLLDAGDAEGLRRHLARHAGLTRQEVRFEGGNYFRNPTLLEFIAENPVRHGTLPANAVEMAKVILEAGVAPEAVQRTLELVATGSVVRGCGLQTPLLELLCAQGADPNQALDAAAIHGEHEAVEALLRLGARMDLATAAALGREGDLCRLLPAANAPQRHLALALAAQFGHAGLVRLLLDAGEDPDRYNPPGGHAHSTPMHEAALAGHEAVVRLLVERGARLDIRDLHWQGTPADWAAHAGRGGLEAHLRERERA